MLHVKVGEALLSFVENQRRSAAIFVAPPEERSGDPDSLLV